jgi:SPP1 gp7 family putative phage head morphogenesis protein
MLADVFNRDAKQWHELSKQMGISLRTEIAMAPTGEKMRELLAEQVSLITSLPLDAAIRVQQIALGNIYEGARPATMHDLIMQSGQVSKSRATLIARTETARVSSLLTQARAQNIGSEGYIWRTVGDADVRPRHRKLEGKFIKWSEPPVAGENGELAHAGQIYNCRCFAEPIIPGM